MGYLGSKAGAGVCETIIALMPPHDTYVELFCGSGVVLERKPRSERSFAIDLNEEALRGVRKQAGLVKLCEDAFGFLTRFDFESMGRVLIYADPPYLHRTRTSSLRYKFELTDDQHLQLLGALKAAPAKVILSGYPSRMYDEELASWWRCEFQAMSRGGCRTEVLWSNFEPGPMHWASYAGENFVDRQRIKRKAARWASMYAEMPYGERLAVLAALLSTHGATQG